MKSFNEMLFERHSIRRYTDEPLDADEVKKILEAALLAPSSKSSRPWQFIVVEDKDELQRLSEMKVGGTVPVKNCAMAVIVIVDPSKSEAWIEDGSVAASFMLLQAAALGLGACWVEIRGRQDREGEPSEAFVREALNIPEELVPMCVVTFGHINETRRPVDPDKLLWEKVHIGKFKQPE